MANSFTRSDIIAAWRFESGALATAAKGGVNLTLVGTPTEDTTNKKEGDCAISLNGTSQYAKILDGDLPAGFPFKSGGTVTWFSIGCWVRPTTVDTNKRRIWAKYKASGNQKGFELYHNSTNIYFQYATSGSASAEVSTTAGAMTANQWYYLKFTFFVPLGQWVMSVYNDTAGTWLHKTGYIGSWGGVVNCPTADWRIGADDDGAANTFFAGQIDEVVVSNSKLHLSEAVALKGGTFPPTGLGIYDYLYDPTNGLDTNDGCVAAWKTLKKAIYAGDIIHLAKSAEADQAGTVTVTKGSVTVNTTSDLSAALPQYSFVRFGTDMEFYMVNASTSSTLTLLRPYRGNSASGIVVKKLTLQTVTGSGDIAPTTGAGVGYAGSPIVLNCGVDLSTLIQDGVTIFNCNSQNFLINAGLSYWNVTGKLGVYYCSGMCNGSLTDVNFDYLSVHRISLATLYSGTWTRVNITKVISENGLFPGGGVQNCIFNELDTYQNNNGGIVLNGYSMDSIFYHWVNVGSNLASSYALLMNGYNWGIRFVDPILDESNSGTKLIGSYNATTFCDDVILYNPKIGSGVLFNFGGSFNFFGEISLVNVNGYSNDHRSMIACGPVPQNQFVVRQTDNTIYNTAAPSVKITLPGALATGPYYDRFYVPCEAGVAKTVKAYLRKNSSYGSLTLPFMRLRWFTGTEPDLVHNQHDVAMPDINDTFEEVSYEVTPSVKGTIIVEIYGQSANAGAIFWYDDIPEAVA